MARWQRKARLGVAIFGIVFAIVVYTAIGERQPVTQAARPSRFDPKAVLESIGAKVQQVRLAKQDYVVEADRQLTYEDGTTKLVGVRIKIPQREGRDVTISGREAQAGNDQKELQLTGDVKLASSDGFEVTTATASFDQKTGVLLAPDAVAFSKGGLNGSGIGMTYDNNSEILSLTEMAHVVMKDKDDKVTMEFTSGSATLARHKYLELTGSVHALRGDQVLEADHGVARLTEDEEHIPFIELRGNSRVTGGGTFDAMSARDIDLDYSDDGSVLERVVLTGSGAIAMAGQNGASGRQFIGDTLTLAFAPDATVTRVDGQGNVRVNLPAANDAPARTVTARVFDGTGMPGAGLTSARFTDDVEYREEAQRGSAPRTAKSRSLVIGLAQDAVTSALFSGAVKFEEEGLQASAAQAQYDPVKGTLQLSGADAGGGPRVSDPNISIDAGTIDVALQTRKMTARDAVKTTLRARSDNKLPGLLKEGQGANVNAATLEYQGAGGKAVYSGMAALWQGETAIRGDVITLDQEKGDLLASGAARSTLMLDSGVSIGTANEIRYDDAKRLITYNTPPPAAAKPALAAVAQSHLSGSEGDIRADRIEIQLGTDKSAAERLEAYTNVTVRVDTRVATGARLTYFSDDERYLLSGAPNVGVRVVDQCRETTGKTLTFFKSTDRIIVDGNEELRTQTKRGGPCPAPPAR